MQRDVLFSSEETDWHTPAWVLERVVETFGRPIDLDPCSNIGAPVVNAERHFTVEQDGLAQEWCSPAAYLNPPYTRRLGRWTRKLVESYNAGLVKQAVLLVPARTSNAWWKDLQPYPVVFLQGRLHFSGSVTGAPFPSALVYLGPNVGRFFYAFAPFGAPYLSVPWGERAQGAA